MFYSETEYDEDTDKESDSEEASENLLDQEALSADVASELEVHNAKERTKEEKAVNNWKS